MELVPTPLEATTALVTLVTRGMEGPVWTLMRTQSKCQTASLMQQSLETCFVSQLDYCHNDDLVICYTFSILST